MDSAPFYFAFSPISYDPRAIKKHFYSTVVSSLAVPSYSSRSSADDFPTKSLCPERSSIFWCNRIKTKRNCISYGSFFILRLSPFPVIHDYIRALNVSII